jgi:hypothetical protein
LRQPPVTTYGRGTRGEQINQQQRPRENFSTRGRGQIDTNRPSYGRGTRGGREGSTNYTEIRRPPTNIQPQPLNIPIQQNIPILNQQTLNQLPQITQGLEPSQIPRLPPATNRKMASTVPIGASSNLPQRVTPIVGTQAQILPTTNVQQVIPTTQVTQRSVRSPAQWNQLPNLM